MDESGGTTNLGYVKSKSGSVNSICGSSNVRILDGDKLSLPAVSKSNARSFSSGNDNGDLSRPGISQRRSLSESGYVLSPRNLESPFSSVHTFPKVKHPSEHKHLCIALNHPSLSPDKISQFSTETTPEVVHPSKFISCNENLYGNDSHASDNTFSNAKLRARHLTMNGIKRKFSLISCERVNVLLKYTLTYPLLVGGIWSFLYILWGQYAFVDGSLFALLTLEVLAIFLGFVADLLSLPPLLGMLSAGLILRNVPYINVAKNLSLSISSPLRAMSVVVLLTKGAFGINPSNIKRFRNVVPSLAVGSCIIEAIFGSVSSYFILGFPPAWAALMGCILSAMSGFAVLPYLLQMDKSTVNSKPKVKETLVIAKTACGMDAILAICMAKCCLGFVFGEGNLGPSLLKGIGEVALGGLWGTFWGSASGFLLLDTQYTDAKVIAIVCGGVMSLLGMNKISFARGGPLGVFLGSLIAVNVWRSKGASNVTSVSSAVDKLWFVFQPLLFGIIGSRTDFSSNVDWSIVWHGAICLLISISSRIAATFLMTNFGDLPWRSRLFLAVSWLPKGTVQAALGPVALDTSTNLGLPPEFIQRGNNVMNVAVTTIVLAGLIGSLLLKLLGLRILKVD